uniref:PB1-like domain-containing protein n=1 Tax=Chenopodium quinoa TaxID=63459 RepID=A0A803N4Q7_CHEQI
MVHIPPKINILPKASATCVSITINRGLFTTRSDGPAIQGVRLEMEDPFSAITLKYWFGGSFKTVANRELVYVGGKGKTFNIDPDLLCWWWLEDFAKKCDGIGNIEFMYYLVSGLSLVNGLRKSDRSSDANDEIKGGEYDDEDVKEQWNEVLNEDDYDGYVSYVEDDEF